MVLALLLALAAPPSLVRNMDGSTTLTAAVSSALPPPRLEMPGPQRRAARRRGRADADTAVARAFDEAVDEVRQAQRRP
jgi:hypothetical protein